LLPKEAKFNTQASSILRFKERNWSFIPITPIDKSPDYRILKQATGQTKWAQFQHRKPNNTESVQFLKAYGFAVITGKISNIVVLDVDVKKGDGFKSLKGKELPPTPTARTQSGGAHYYFKYPKFQVKSHTNLLPNVDIKADGGYVVTPLTPGYEWYEYLSPEEVPLADLPKWLEELLYEEDYKKGEASNEYYSLLTTPCNIPRLSNKAKTISINKPNLQEWYSKKEVADSFMKMLRIDKEIGQAFKCILPGHKDNKPSSSIYQGRNGVYIYRDFHGAKGEQILLLPEVYASLHYKRVVSASDKLAEKEIGKPEVATWGIRLLVDMGFIKPHKVDYKPLKEKVPPTIKKTYEGFIRLLECKYIYSPNEPTPFSWRFASAWCQVSERKAGEAIKWLLSKGYIKEQGKTSGKRPMSLFMLG